MQCFSVLTDHGSLLIGFAQESPYWRFLLIPSQASAACMKRDFILISFSCANLLVCQELLMKEASWRKPQDETGVSGGGKSNLDDKVWLRVSEMEDSFRKSGVNMPLYWGLQLKLKWRNPWEWAKDQRRKTCEYSLHLQGGPLFVQLLECHATVRQALHIIHIFFLGHTTFLHSSHSCDSDLPLRCKL